MKAREYYDRLAPQLDERAWDADSAPWARWSWQVVERELGHPRDAFVVDLGSGTGGTVLNLLRFTQGRFLGVDFSPEMVRLARAKDYGDARVEFRICRIDQLRLPPGSVDHVISAGTFHHLRNKARILANVAGMLRPGGKFVCIDQFRSGPRYRAETERLRRSHQDEAAENDRVLDSFRWIYEQDRDHPREYACDPYELAGLTAAAGLVDARVHVSLQPDFSVVTATRPTT